MRNEEEGCWVDNRVYLKIVLESRFYMLEWKWVGGMLDGNWLNGFFLVIVFVLLKEN